MKLIMPIVALFYFYVLFLYDYLKLNVTSYLEWYLEM